MAASMGSNYAKLETSLDFLKSNQEKIDGKLDAIGTALTAHLARNESYCKKIDELSIEINGNGKNGLKTDVKTLMDWMRSSKWFGRVVAAAAITSAISTIVMLVINLN